MITTSNEMLTVIENAENELGVGNVYFDMETLTESEQDSLRVLQQSGKIIGRPDLVNMVFYVELNF